MGLERDVAMSDGAWAWEGLRRNPAYRAAWAHHENRVPVPTDARGSLRYLRAEKPCFEAETFGLIVFADPDLPASEAPVFWEPGLLAGTLSVRLGEVSGDGEQTDHGLSIGSLRCCPTVLDTVDGLRHIRLGGHAFWIQMTTQDRPELSEDTPIEVVLDGRDGVRHRIRTLQQIMNIHETGSVNAALPKHFPKRVKLAEGLLAYDVAMRMDGGRGTLREVAVALFGSARIDADWPANKSLKNYAARARDRGRLFVEGGYRGLLRSAAF